MYLKIQPYLLGTILAPRHLTSGIIQLSVLTLLILTLINRCLLAIESKMIVVVLLIQMMMMIEVILD
jgi:hypothetical protein